MLARKVLSWTSTVPGRHYISNSSVICKKASSPLAKLRKKSGYSLSLCKKALAENEDDVDKAFHWLQEQAQAQGWDKANKLEGRTTAHGLIGLKIQGQSGVMVEVNCETDFVARNKQFISLVQSVTDLNLTASKDLARESAEFSSKLLSKEEVDGIKQENGKSLADLIALNIGQIGENISSNRAIHFGTNQKHTTLVGITHPNGDETSFSFGKYGVLMVLKHNPQVKLPDGLNIRSFGLQLCQHVIGMNPETVGDINDPSTWPSKIVKEEEPVQEENVDNPYGDFDETAEKQNLGTSETQMIHQPFIFDSDRLVREVLLEAGVEIKTFIRYEVGQQ